MRYPIKLTRTELLNPQLIRIGVSRLCNHNCLMCWNYSSLLVGKKSREWQKVMIDKNIMLRTISEAKKIGFKQVLLSGRGEPFSHPNILDFVKKISKEKMGIIFQTNLSLVSESSLVFLLKNVKKNSIVCVNLSATNRAIYNKVHGLNKGNLFNEVLEKMRYLIKKSIRVRYVFIVTKLNYKDIEKAFDLNKRLNSFLHLELMDYVSDSGANKIAITSKIKSELIKKLSLKISKFKDNSNIVDFINQIKYRGIGVKKIYNCLIGNNFCAIDETGKVDYCFNMGAGNYYRMGDLSKNTLKDIWFSKKYNSMRKKLSDGKLLPSCKKCLKRGSNFKLRFFIKEGMTKPYA